MAVTQSVAPFRNPLPASRKPVENIRDQCSGRHTTRSTMDYLSQCLSTAGVPGLGWAILPHMRMTFAQGLPVGLTESLRTVLQSEALLIQSSFLPTPFAHVSDLHGGLKALLPTPAPPITHVFFQWLSCTSNAIFMSASWRTLRDRLSDTISPTHCLLPGNRSIWWYCYRMEYHRGVKVNELEI